MRRIALLLTEALLVGLLLGGILEAQQPGTFVVSGQILVETGCFAYLNDEQALKKTGLCTFAVVAEGIKLTDLECHSGLSGNQGTTLLDTIIDCTYSPVKKLVANPDAPNVKGGTLILPQTQMSLGPDGCAAYINNPGNAAILGKCGFNVNIQLTAIPHLSCTTKVSGGNTTITCTFPPVIPQPAPAP